MPVPPTACCRGQHVFQPIVAVRGLLAYPVHSALDHSAEPVRPEAEQVAIEGVLDGAAVHQVADVNDVVADGVGGSDRLRVLRQLHELHLVAFRVFDVEPAAAVGCPFPLGPAPSTTSAEIAAQRLSIVGVPCGVVQAVDARVRGQGQHLNELRGAERIAHAFGVLRIGLLYRADDLPVEVIGGRRDSRCRRRCARCR